MVAPRQEAFVREFCADLNGTQAAIRAGYSPQGSQGPVPATCRQLIAREFGVPAAPAGAIAAALGVPEATIGRAVKAAAVT